MILAESKTVRGRWFKIDKQSFYDLIKFIDYENPTKTQVQDYLNIGMEKVRALVEYLQIFGIIDYDRKRKRIVLNKVFVLIKDIITNKEFAELMMYCFIQNYDFMNWFFTDFVYDRITEKNLLLDLNYIKDHINYFTDNYNSKVQIDSIAKQFNREKKLLTDSNCILSELNIVKENKNQICISRYNEISIKMAMLMFYLAWNEFYQGITNIRLEDIIKSKRFPFRSFLMNENKAKQLMIIFERYNIIKMVEIADVKHITINKELTYEDIAKKMREVD